MQNNLGAYFDVLMMRPEVTIDPTVAHLPWDGGSSRYLELDTVQLFPKLNSQCQIQSLTAYEICTCDGT